MDIKAIVLAAGKGTRMKSATPKVLHEILGKPLLGYVLDNVEPLVSETFVVVGHQAELVERYADARPKTKAVYQYPQLGTGDAVSKVIPYLEDYDGLVLVLCGDTPLITAETLKKFILIHTENHTDLTVMSAILDDPTGYGRMVLEGNTLKGIVEEKDATPKQKAIKEVNAGVYLFNWQKFKDAFANLTSNNAQGEFYLTDIVQQAKTAVIYTLENNDEIFGINSRGQLAQAAAMLNNRKLARLMDEGVTIVDPKTTWISEDTSIDEDTIVYPSTYITGRNTIGKNCKIGPFAHLRGNVQIADNVKIGNFVEVKNSKIDKNTNVSHLSYIGDSDVGSGVNVGAGTITANYNALTKEKSKTTVGSNVKIGSNSVLVAPVEIKDGANIGAGSVITKDIPERALAFTRAALKIVENWAK